MDPMRIIMNRPRVFVVWTPRSRWPNDRKLGRWWRVDAGITPRVAYVRCLGLEAIAFFQPRG